MTSPPGISFYNQDRFTNDDFVANFVARGGQVEALLNGLRHIAKGGETEHQILIGARGMGKTSLLRRVAIGVVDDPVLNAAFVPLRFREEQYNIISLDAFWRNCGESLAEYCEQRGNQALADRLDVAIETPEWRDAEVARDGFLAACQEAGGRAILLLDNLDLILEGIKTEGCWSLRSALQKADGPIVIGAATQLLTQGAEREAPFYEFFHPQFLEPLTELELFACLNALAMQRGEAGVPVAAMLAREPERIRALYVLTGGNPRVLALVYQLLERTESETIFVDLEALLDQVTPFYKARIEEYQTPLQRAVIDGIALNWDPITSASLSKQTGVESTTLSAQLNRLKKDGLVEEVETSGTRAGYQLAERFLNIWYLMRHGTRKTKARLRWFTIFLTKLFSTDELQRMAGDARDGAGTRWHPDHCEAVIEAYEIKRRNDGSIDRTFASEAIERAFLANEEGRPEDAIAICDDVLARFGSSKDIKLHPQVAMALICKGFSFFTLKQWEQEIASYEEIISRFGSRRGSPLTGLVAAALANKGLALSRSGQYEQAVVLFDQVIARVGKSRNLNLQKTALFALFNMADRLNQLERFEDAMGVYDEAITRFGMYKDSDLQAQFATTLINKGVMLGKQGHPEKEISVYDEVVARFGASVDPELQEAVATALINKGIRLGRLGRSEEAIAVYDEVLVRFDENEGFDLQANVAQALFNKGVRLDRLERLEESILVYDDLLERFAANDSVDMQIRIVKTLINKGGVLNRLQRLDKAVAVYDSVIAYFGSSENPDIEKAVATALVNKGIVLGKQNREADEIEAYDEVVARFGLSKQLGLQEQVAKALGCKADLLAARGQPEEAVGAYAALLELCSASPELAREYSATASVNLGKTLFWMLAREDDGVRRLSAVLDADPQNVFAGANLLWMKLAQGLPDDAVRLRSTLDSIDNVGKALMLAGIDLASENLGASLARLGEALDKGFAASQDDFDYFEDLLWYLRIAAKRGNGERLIAWFTESGQADRYAPLYGAFVAHVRGERHLLDLNPEVRGVAQPLFETLSGRGPGRKYHRAFKAGKRKPKR